MSNPSRWIYLALALALLSTSAANLAAQESVEPEEPAEETMDEVDDVIVVTASKYEQSLHEVPAAITVLDEKALEKIPSDNYGDLLRNVPGLNVSQMSARDINISGRQATASLANTSWFCSTTEPSTWTSSVS